VCRPATASENELIDALVHGKAQCIKTAQATIHAL
jgi:hypothetical protein